ncbi:MAG TPA: hypothetical protein VGL20_07890 [Candidatus Dormibacteraeota bacterium]
MELVTEEAVLGIIDDWWRWSPVRPLKAAQITLRLGPQLRRPVEVPLLIPDVVGVVRDLARRGYVRALPDGSAILSYLPAIARTGGRDPWSDPALPPGRTGSPPAWGPVAAAATPAAVVSTAIAPTWGTVGPFVPAPVEPWPARPQHSGGGSAALGIRRADRLIVRLALVFFLVVTIAVVATLDRLIDIPIRTHGVLYCGDSGQPSSGLPQCAGGR